MQQQLCSKRSSAVLGVGRESDQNIQGIKQNRQGNCANTLNQNRERARRRDRERGTSCLRDRRALGLDQESGRNSIEGRQSGHKFRQGLHRTDKGMRKGLDQKQTEFVPLAWEGRRIRPVELPSLSKTDDRGSKLPAREDREK